MAAKVLNSLGVDIDEVRSSITRVLGANERILIQHIIPTSRVKTVIETSFKEARRLGNSYVGTEHLLLGLLIEGEGIAAHVLEDLGANLEKVRAVLDGMLEAGERDPEEVSGAERISGGPSLRPFVGHRTRSHLDPIQLAAERLAAEQHTTVGVEQALLAALDADPLVRRMLAALGIDEAKLAELRRIATPPEHLVELRRAYQAKAAETRGWRAAPIPPPPSPRIRRGRSGAPSGAPPGPTEAGWEELRRMRDDLRRLGEDLDEAERRWRSGEEIEGPDPASGANQGS